MALSPLLNGERAVVFLYVAQILYSTPLALLQQAFSITLLSVFALAVEISADHASNPLAAAFATRPGASTGILLGAVTVPGLMLSRLIQSLRGVALGQVELHELQYLMLQYWAAISSCIAVLVFLCVSCHRHQAKSSSQACFVFSLNAKFSFVFTTLLVAFGLVSFSGISYDVWPMALMLLWVLCHGLSSVKLIQKILHMFPACASIGESLLVTTGLVLYFGDMLAHTATKIHGYFAYSEAQFLQNGINRSEISTIIQGVIFGLLFFPLFYKFVLRMSEYFFGASNHGDLGNQEKRRSFVFYASLGVMLLTVVPSWMQLVHPFQAHPFIWIFEFVFSEPLKRLSLCTYWLVVIYFCIRRFYSISKDSKTERILLRKYYHLMAVSIFVPAIIFQPRFLNLAFGAALAVFLLLEIIRIWKIWPLGHLVHHFMNAFTDHRDSDLLVVSHFSLLLGCALPIWLSSGFSDRPLAPFAGILSLGIGDTMASMVGHKYGVLRWTKSGKKTIEGTAAGITSVLAACVALLPLLAATGYIFTMHWFSLVLAVTTSGLLEAYTAQLDNAFIPLIFYSLLCL